MGLVPFPLSRLKIVHPSCCTIKTHSAKERKLQISIKEQRKMMDKERRRVLYALLRVARENACYDKLYMERLQCNCRTLAEAMQLSNRFGHLISDHFVDIIYIISISYSFPLCFIIRY